MSYLLQHIDGTFIADDVNVLLTPFAALAKLHSEDAADAWVLRNPRYRKLLVVPGVWQGYGNHKPNPRITSFRSK